MKKLLAVFLLLFLNKVNATDAMVINADAKQTTFLITLPANPTTGYRWTIKRYDNSLLQRVSSQYIAPQTKRIGVGGKMSFTFKRITKTCPQKTEIIFKYAQPWQPAQGTLKKVIV